MDRFGPNSVPDNQLLSPEMVSFALLCGRTSKKKALLVYSVTHIDQHSSKNRELYAQDFRKANHQRSSATCPTP